MNLLEGFENEINSAMKSVFDTFKRNEPFYFYKPAEEEVIIFDENFNADLQEYNNPNAEYTVQAQPFYCRVIYPKRENTLETSMAGGANLQIKGLQDLGIIYLQMEEDAYDYIKDSIRFTFMGDKYEKFTSPRKLGILGTFNIFQITLKKVN